MNAAAAAVVVGARVRRMENRPQVLATVAEVVNTTDGTGSDGGAVLLLIYDEGGAGWWPLDAVEVLTP